MQNGQVYRWVGTMAATLTEQNLLASFDSSYWSDPSKLWDAQPASNPPVTLSTSGSRLSIARPAGYTGSFLVEVTVSDGVSTHSRRFWVNAN